MLSIKSGRMLTTPFLIEAKNAPEESHRMHLQRGNLIVRAVGITHVIPFADVFLAEADSNYTILHLRHGNRIITSQVLARIAMQLPPCQFLRIHQSYLIRMDAIRTYHRFASTIELQGVDRLLPVAKTKKKSLHHILY
jgi:DNA-binding LytR/AlgR family response regulator